MAQMADFVPCLRLADVPLEFGLRITTLVRDTTEEAWRDAERKVAQLSEAAGQSRTSKRPLASATSC